MENGAQNAAVHRTQKSDFGERVTQRGWTQARRQSLCQRRAVGGVPLAGGGLGRAAGFMSRLLRRVLFVSAAALVAAPALVRVHGVLLC